MALCPQLEMGNLVLTAPEHDLLRVNLIPLVLSTSLEYVSSSKLYISNFMKKLRSRV